MGRAMVMLFLLGLVALSSALPDTGGNPQGTDLDTAAQEYRYNGNDGGNYGRDPNAIMYDRNGRILPSTAAPDPEYRPSNGYNPRGNNGYRPANYRYVPTNGYDPYNQPSNNRNRPANYRYMPTNGYDPYNQPSNNGYKPEMPIKAYGGGFAN